AINRMKNLNNAISQIEGLSSAYHIGASYFLKLKNYDNDFGQLWDYHIEGLLREYLRGYPNIVDSLNKLKSAFNNENQDDSSDNN
ncbi:MAG: endonuclease, partial [Paludibacteraceae bacterium]|nr:endonuclease [Paludibacteraceae bacterium]